MPRRGTRASESGFTLPELLIAIVILGIIIVPLSTAMIVGLTTTTDAQKRLSESRAAVFTSAYFANDVQSADTVQVGGSPVCGSGTNIITMRWADDLSATNAANYVVQVNGTTRQLVRIFCQSGAVVDQGPVAPDLAVADPTVTCSPNCTKPRSVVLTLSTPSGYTVTLNGTRRPA